MKTNPLAEPRAARPWGAAVLIGGLSLVYYAWYFDAGFNFSDEGNYAQFVYELAHGASLNDLPVGYGLLWFKIGEGLFRLFGPHFLLARALFFACALVTALLVYAAVFIVTRRPWFAALIAAVPALAPAFLPTAFYGLCILINTVPQLLFARRLEEACPRDAAFAGAALAISFQIRPDFGYIFAIPLALLLIAATLRGERRHHLIGSALAAFVAAHAPGLFLAVGDGYLGALVGQYLSYPVMLAKYAFHGVATLAGGVAETPAAGTLLARPRLFGAADSAELRLALLVYLPIVIIVAFPVYNVARLRGEADRVKSMTTMLVVLFAGAAALPHYFFYRPDLSHIANFMPGFAVLAGVFAWQVVAWTRGIMLIFPILIALTLGLYAAEALTHEGTGSIAGSFARTEHFEAGNGVKVRVYPGEKALLEDLKSVIEANSKPGDTIVCVPYCPGIAFMTGRRLLFREQYVDDALPLRDPQWLARAIALTEEKRPPVVIVMDWAINGTDISRFSRWAAPYMEALETLKREKLERPGLSIYLL
ncbi:MAG: hypothetical protein LCH56_12190 [Proteobacteria bacterium]|nr:hypothetical protein [Pseudomonadota bacterium]